MHRLYLPFTVLFLFLTITFLPSPAQAQPNQSGIPEISGGAEAIDLAKQVTDVSNLEGSPTHGVTGLNVFLPGVSFLAYNYDDNVTETGFMLIPPDPCGAAGTDRVIAVVNVGIECRNKAGALLWRDSLRDFFSTSTLGLGTLSFDPKIVYDHYENRFVVVTLERLRVVAGDATDASRILVAVSKTSTPATATAADWWFMAIDSKVNIGGTDYWADYPGFEIDEEAVYITNNMFDFSAAGAYGGVRLWIIDKGTVGGFYAGGAPVWNIYDPIPAGFYALTTQPALVFGPGGAGTNIGTYLVGYSSLTSGGVGGSEWIQVIRVDNPLAAPTFSGQFINVGDLEDVGGVFGFPAMPDAPQLGTATLIEVNDSRALDAVWRNNNLWFTTTITPNVANDATNAGQATAHWFRVNTTTPAALALADQGNIGGEDIAPDASTFFPSVAVNMNDAAKFGYSASASTIYAGAYYSGREVSDPAGTVQAAGTVQVGLDFYQRTFGTGRNRWGDYTGAAVDPSDDTTFWIFNEYAMTRGTGTAPEDGRWATAWASCLQSGPQDFGDCPDPSYQTLLASNGPRHNIVAGIMMGAQIDPEPDGIPHLNALGDDLTALPDEDGVNVVTPLVPGGAAQIDVTVSVTGWVDLWIDFDLDGIFTPADLMVSQNVIPGLNNLFFVVPAYALPGTATFMRVRYNLAGPLPPTGPANDGEVEDYEVFVDENEGTEDFGDAPDPTYQTLLATNGARHTIVPGVFMGAQVDAELDGQPDPAAKGDDINNLPDEDGVTYITNFVPGSPAQIDILCSTTGWLDVFIDFDLDGLFTPADLIFSGPAAIGVNSINFAVPVSAVVGSQTFLRARFNTAGPLPPDGPAADGEVEDHELYVDEPVDLDFGDAPDPTYPTLLVNDGARHMIQGGVFMGAGIDTEPDGQPDATATGDDLAGIDDEDGVVFVTPLVPTLNAQVDVTVSISGYLDAWVDFNLNGVWDHPAELIYSGGVSTGLNNIVFAVPAGAASGQSFARFRYNTTAAGLLPTGYSSDGEVEDYEIIIEEEPTMDFGDAPDPTFRTLLVNNGARHVVTPGVFMGALIDAEPDGQPNFSATGDDLAGSADEDGVIFPVPILAGAPTQFDVVVSAPGFVDIYVDFDSDFVFTAADLVWSGPVVPGLNPCNFMVPFYAVPGNTPHVRVRYNTSGALPPDGLAADGEVEDYQIVVEDPDLDFGDAPDTPYPTLLASDGARHQHVPGVFMGNLIDTEADGQPDPTATGDDLAIVDDEDGVTFVTGLTANTVAQIDVVVSQSGWLDAWVDYDQNGVFDHPAELIYSGGVSAGLNSLFVNVPAGAVPGTTYSRFRYNINGSTYLPTGYAPDGEVEDYEIDVAPEPVPTEDFGDAPDPTYQTLLASNGARHLVVPGIFLGNLIDAELDGQPDPTATGDDLANLPDEDGVVFVTPIIPGTPGQIDVFPSVGGWVDIWIDFDLDGMFTPADLVFSGPVVPGLNAIPYTLPGLAGTGPSFARIRYNTAGPLPPDGPAPDGEVEDYEVIIEQPPLDFGDAPDAPYPTLLATNGARHVIVPGVFMGNAIDAEIDGQPNANATGDDSIGAADEDGVTFMTPLTVGGTPQVEVTVSVAGWVDLWMDLNQDGTWSAGELLYSGNVAAGANQFLISIPAGSLAGTTFTRVRYNLGGALPVTGAAGDGEVEDYEVTIQTVTGLPGETGQFLMGPATPNPFLHQTTIAYEIPSEEHVKIEVFTLSGRLVNNLVDERLPAGVYSTEWTGISDRGEAMPSGVYFLRFKAGSKTFTQRVIFIK